MFDPECFRQEIRKTHRQCLNARRLDEQLFQRVPISSEMNISDVLGDEWSRSLAVHKYLDHHFFQKFTRAIFENCEIYSLYRLRNYWSVQIKEREQTHLQDKKTNRIFGNTPAKSSGHVQKSCLCYRHRIGKVIIVLSIPDHSHTPNFRFTDIT